MPRLHATRPPATPRTEAQTERYRRMLRAATALGAEHGLEQLQMSDVAARAEVALGTLYRYFPSKHHLFAGVLADQVERVTITPDPERSAPEDVADLIAGAVRGMLISVPLARAMIISINVIRTEYDTAPPLALDELILRVASLERVSAEDRRTARLVEQCAYGVLTWATAGEITPAQAVDDVRRGCELLLAGWSGRRRSSRPAAGAEHGAA